jgi:long-subunit acyl-CoA synthetase (AMP-forming)
MHLKIESLFKNNPLFSHVMVIGDARKYLTALYVLDSDVAAQMAKSHRIGFESREKLLDDPAFRVIIDKIVDENN